MTSDPKNLTLPVWVTAAVKAATEVLMGKPFSAKQKIFLPKYQESILVPVRSSELILDGQIAIGISFADSGIALDITRDLEIWACVQLQKHLADIDSVSDSWLKLVAGSGVGKSQLTDELCLSDFARELLHFNLRSLVPSQHFLKVEIVFPKGRQLAERTSNKAFGVVDGLAIIGTQAEAQISASPEQLNRTIEKLKMKCAMSNFAGDLTFCLDAASNG